MNITINNEILDFQLEGEKTIGEVLGKIEAMCNSKKNTIFAIEVEGKELQADELDELFEKPIEENANIDLTTISGDEVKEKLITLGETFKNLAVKMEEIPVKMQTGDDNFAIETVSEFSDNLNLMFRFFAIFDVLGLSTDVKLEGRNVQEYQKEISPLLIDLIEALEDKDIITVGDISEYELSPLAKDLGNGLLSL